MKTIKEIFELYMNGFNDIADTLQELSKIGYCPCLLNDDNGHWSLSFSGACEVSETESPISCSVTSFVEKGQWFASIEEAVEKAIQESI